jgi:hypothetical protein
MIALFIWIVYVMYDSYERGATELSCADEHGIWWFIVWAYLWALLVACGRAFADASLAIALALNNPSPTESLWWKGSVFLFSYVANTVLLVAVAVWGYTMWSTMPDSCDLIYQQKYEDLLLIFHVYVILFAILAIVYVVLGACLVFLVYFGLISSLPLDHPLHAVVEPVTIPLSLLLPCAPCPARGSLPCAISPLERDLPSLEQYPRSPPPPVHLMPCAKSPCQRVRECWRVSWLTRALNPEMQVADIVKMSGRYQPIPGGKTEETTESPSESQA